LQQRGGGIRQDAMARVFVDEFMPEMRLVDVRLTEQEQSGTVQIVDGCVRLTEKGQELASFGFFFAAISCLGIACLLASIPMRWSILSPTA
jgi:hypothetical protein